jgi:hypothetical protein
MASLSVVREVRIDAAPDAVWRVLSTPTMQPVVEPRARLLDERGEPGTPGSSYDLKIRGRRLHYRVKAAQPGETYDVAVEMGGRPVASQSGAIRRDGAGCYLTWTVLLEVPLLLRPLARANCNKELTKWLEAVAKATSDD